MKPTLDRIKYWEWSLNNDLSLDPKVRNMIHNYIEDAKVRTLEIPHGLAVTGRIKSFLEDPTRRLPVSCTVFAVEDTMDESSESIEQSWLFVSKALRYGAGVAVDLSALRPSDTPNGKGMVSSGPVSFAQIYSKLNQILRRGGTYRNGAITLYLDYNHADCEDFLNLPANALPWAKKAIYVDGNVISHPLKKLIIQKLAEGSIFLAKKQYDQYGNRLYSNVCMEILLKSRATCLLSHVNLGQLEIEEIPKAFEDSMEFLCQIHGKTGVGKSGIYLSSKKDRQVGLGVTGLASLLAIENVSYERFVEALDEQLILERTSNTHSKAHLIAKAIRVGYSKAKLVAQRYGMERAFTVAPCARVFTDYTDRDGYQVTPEISAPIDREIYRESETFGSEEFEFHPKVETARDVGWNTQFRLLKVWQRLMNTTKMAHSISANIWSSAKIDNKFLNDFLTSDLKTTYYRWDITSGRAQDKSEIIEEDDSVACNLDGECSSCAE